jgi:hypothetical protein
MGLKLIGTVLVREKHRLICHCGVVELEINLPNGVVDPKRCNCSFCRRRGAVMGTMGENDFQIITGHNNLKLYQFGTKVSEHYFCDTCGIYTHHRRRSDPRFFGYNIGCLEGVNPFDIENIPTSDGINHPLDRKPDALLATHSPLQE